MTIGAGKYDDLCTYVRQQANADVAIVIVAGGDKGSGFSCQANDAADMVPIPNALEKIAAQIRKDIGN